MKSLVVLACISSVLLQCNKALAQINASDAWISDGICYVVSWEYPSSASMYASATSLVNGVSYPALPSALQSANVTGNLSVQKIQTAPPNGDLPGQKITPQASFTAKGEYSQRFIRTQTGTNNNSVFAVLFNGTVSAAKTGSATVSGSGNAIYTIYTLTSSNASPIPTYTRQSIPKTCNSGDPVVNIAGGFNAPTASEYILPFTLSATGTGTGTTDSGGTVSASSTFKYKLP